MKLPVFRAIGATFAFAIQHWLDILKIVWLPVVLMFVFYVLVMPGYSSTMAELSALGPTSTPEEINQRMMAILPPALMLTGVMLAFNLIIFSGVLKLLVRGERPHLPFYFALGMDELRMVAAWLISFGALIAVFAATFVLMQLGSLLASMGPGPGVLVNFLAIIGCMIVCFFLSLKLSLASPATIGTRKIGIIPSWTATEDNVGPLLGYWILWALMSIVLSVVLSPLLTPPGYGEAVRDLMFSGTESEIEAAVKRLQEISMSMYKFSDVGNTIRLVATFLINIVIFVFMAIAGGVAWRYLTDKTQTA